MSAAAVAALFVTLGSVVPPWVLALYGVFGRVINQQYRPVLNATDKDRSTQTLSRPG